MEISHIKLRTKTILALFILVIMIGTMSVVFFSFRSQQKGILITFKGLDENELFKSTDNSAGNTKIINRETGEKLRVEVQVEAIVPSGPNATEKIFIGFLNGSKLLLNPEKNTKFKEILEKWNNLHTHETLKNNLKTSLIISIWIFKGEEIYRVVPDKIVEYNPKRALEDLTTSWVMVRPEELEKIETTNGSKSFHSKNGGYYIRFEWVKDSDLSWEPTEYMKVPILIVKNPESRSGVIGASIVFSYETLTDFRMTFSYGFKIEQKAKNQEYDVISLDVYSTGISISNYYSFAEEEHIHPGESKWFYIWARPAHIHYKERKVYYVGGVPGWYEWTGEEKMEDLIRSVKTEGLEMQGGVETGLPPCKDKFFEGTEKEHPYISGTSLSDGKLSPRESLDLRFICNYYDVYGVGFGIGIPVGALAAVALSATPVAFLAPVVEPLSVSVGYTHTESIRISGVIKNHGEYYGYGYDISEEIWVRVSKYRYKIGSHTYKVPSGLYIECVTYTSPPPPPPRPPGSPIPT